MKYQGKAVLRDGSLLALRSLCADDAQEMISLCKRTAGETLNMMYDGEEWTSAAAQQREAIARAGHDPHALMLGAFIDGRLIGLCSLRPAHPAIRARHRAALGICVIKACWGRGVGQALMETAIRMAKASALEQLELDVLTGNTPAIRLYKKMGFVEVGLRPRLMKYRDGTYADALSMTLDLRAQK